jgi:hypothetical protein
MVDYALGPRALIDLIFKVGGLDPAYIMNVQMREGMNPVEVVSRAAAAVGAKNQELRTRYGAISYYTTDIYARYRQGTTIRKTPKRAEFSKANAIRGAETGHLLVQDPYTDMLGWSVDYLRDAYPSQIDADIQTLVDGWDDRVDTDYQTRIFSRVEIVVGSGHSVPWAVGSGALVDNPAGGTMAPNVAYDPPQWQNVKHVTTHTHFVWLNESAPKTRADLLTELLKHLRHHGLDAMPFVLVSFDDVDKYGSLTGFEEITSDDERIIQGGTTELRTVLGNLTGVPGTLFGFFKSKTHGRVPLRSHPRVQAGYAAMFISYGDNNVRNGLAVSVRADQPFGLRGIPQGDNSIPPRLDGIQFEGDHGINVNNRLTGVVGYLAAGATDYVTPTFS